MKRILFMATSLIICNAQLHGARALAPVPAEPLEALSPVEIAAQEMYQYAEKVYGPPIVLQREAAGHLQRVVESGVSYEELEKVFEDKLAPGHKQIFNNIHNAEFYAELKYRNRINKRALKKTQELLAESRRK